MVQIEQAYVQNNRTETNDLWKHRDSTDFTIGFVHFIEENVGMRAQQQQQRQSIHYKYNIHGSQNSVMISDEVCADMVNLSEGNKENERNGAQQV